MIKQITFLFILIQSFALQSQDVNIPDPGFLAFLIDEGVDLNSDGVIQVSEAEEVTMMEVLDSYGIVDITGIKSFVNLETLNIGGPLVNVDVSGMPSLERLDLGFDGNYNFLNLENLPELTYASFTGNLLKDVIVHGCPKLEELYLGTFEKLNLEVDNSQSLQLVDISILDYPELGDSAIIKVTNCPNLIEFHLLNDNFVDTLDLSNNPLLTYDPDALMLNYLNMAGCSSITTLDVVVGSIKSLDITNMTSLQEFRGDEVENLVFDGCYNLKVFELFDFELAQLDLSELPYLEEVVLLRSNTLVDLILKNGSGIIGGLLDELEVIENICANEIAVDGLQELFPEATVTSECDFANVGKPFYISGTTFIDTNNDNCASSEHTLPYAKYFLTNGTVDNYFFAKEDGSYEVHLAEGDYSYQPDPNEYSDLFAVNPLNPSVSFPGVGSSAAQDFCLVAEEEIDFMEVSIIPLNAARPGFDSRYMLLIQNTGNIVRGGEISLDFEGEVLEYLSSDQEPIVSDDNNLVWNIDELLPFENHEIRFEMRLNTPMDTPPLTDESILTYQANISPEGNQEPSLYAAELNQDVVNSFDPNDKTCLNGNAVSVNNLDEYLKYMIRFENTGSADAINIVVKDTIDINVFDINTIEVLTASHGVETVVRGDVVDFVFKDINLPFDDENNDGYVTFQIKPKDNLEVGAKLENSAAIFFDFNFPIITNTTSTLVEEPTSTNNTQTTSKELITNNPIREVLVLNGSFGDYEQLEIYNSIGERMLEISLDGSNQSIDVSNFPTGSYVLRVSNKNRVTSKVIMVVND